MSKASLEVVRCVVLRCEGAPNVCLWPWRNSVGTLFVLLRREASRKMPLPVASPAVNEGIIGLGEFFRRATMSNVVCFKKSFKLTSGILIALGKNSTVSASIPALVVGIKTLHIDNDKVMDRCANRHAHGCPKKVDCRVWHGRRPWLLVEQEV